MSILEDAKELVRLARMLTDEDFLHRAVDLRDAVFELLEQNLALKEEVAELNGAADISAELRREENAYYRYRGEDKREGPYCMPCWDYEHKLINLIAWSEDGIPYTRCRICAARGK